MVEAVVEYDYEAVNPDELSLKEGEIITNISRLEEGWWEGELGGRRGMFPDNFVKVIKEDKVEKRNSKSKAPGPPVNGDATSINSHGPQDSADIVKREGAASKRKLRAKVAFSYHPENDDELILEVDDILEVTAQPEEGWWEGKLKGHKGVFPSNFVTLIEGDEDNMEVTNGKADSPVATETKGEDSPKDEEPQPLKQPKVLGGKPVGGVGFGNIFAGGSVHLRKTNQDPVKKPKKTEPPKRPELSEMVQKRQSLRKPVPEDKKEKDVKELKPEKKEEEKEVTITEEIEIVVEKAKVLFDYDAENPDELSMKENDIVIITNKEAGDSGWWEGELNGKRGVFPDNFVSPLPLERTKKRVPAPIPTRPNTGPKTTEEPKPQTAHKPRKASKDLPAKPAQIESELPMEPVIKEESKPLLPPGAKQVLPLVPPKKPNFKKPPPKPTQPEKESREAPKRPPSFTENDPHKEKNTEKKDPTIDSAKADDVAFDDIKPKTEKLTHYNLSRPRNVQKRPPSVFNSIPGVTVNDDAKQHASSLATEQLLPENASLPLKSQPLSTNSSSEQPSWSKDLNLKKASVRRPSPIVLSAEQAKQHASSLATEQLLPENASLPLKSQPLSTNSSSEQPSWSKDLNLKKASVRRPSPIVLSAEQPIENDTPTPPARPKTTPSPLNTATTPGTKQENGAITSPGNNKPGIGTSESNAASAAVLAAVDELKKEVKAMNEQMGIMRSEFKKEVKKLMVEVDEEKKLRLSMQVELERIQKLVLDS